MNLTAGQTKSIDAVLQVAPSNQAIDVHADLHGEAEQIQVQKTSEDIVNVLSADVITSLPNANIADAVGRLPGVTLERDEGEGKYVQVRGTEPRLTNVTIEGINVASPEVAVRQIKLDVIPADLVESVELEKTLSANEDGDAIGGTVNLKLKNAGDQPTLILNGIGGYTPIMAGATWGRLMPPSGSASAWTSASERSSALRTITTDVVSTISSLELTRAARLLFTTASTFVSTAISERAGGLPAARTTGSARIPIFTCITSIRTSRTTAISGFIR